MNDLAGHRIFLSAGFPSGERGDQFQPYDAGDVADAVTALIRAIFSAGGGVVFGGHPTITPLVFFVANEYHAHAAVDVYQSRWFERDIPAETKRFEGLGLGRIFWTERRQSRSESLDLMRHQMLIETKPIAAVFVGGMEGIRDEWETFGFLFPSRPRIPIGAPGGAAARLVEHAANLPRNVIAHLGSRRYAVLAHEIVKSLGSGRDLTDNRPSGLRG